MRIVRLKKRPGRITVVGACGKAVAAIADAGSSRAINEPGPEDVATDSLFHATDGQPAD